MHDELMNMDPIGVIEAHGDSASRARWPTLAASHRNLKVWPLDLGINPFTKQRDIVKEPLFGIVVDNRTIGALSPRAEGITVFAQTADALAAERVAREIASVLGARFVTEDELGVEP